MLQTQLCCQLVDLQISLYSDPGTHLIRDIGHVTISRVDLRVRSKQPSLALEMHHVVDEFDQNA